MSDEKQASVGEALVEELDDVYCDASGARCEGGLGLDARERGIRAVLAHLARRGVEGLPDADDLAEFSRGIMGNHDTVRAVIRFAVGQCRAAFAPILAARDHEIATLRERVAVAEKQAAVFRELQAREIPCGHKVEDLIGGEDGDGNRLVTKCGACLKEREAKRAGAAT